MPKLIKVCLVGAGRAGQVHAVSLTEHIPGATIAALVDPDPTALEKAGARFGVQARFTSLAEAIDKADFDAVVITTPTFTHCDLALEAATGGKHIFCEKPMALSLEECDQMLAATERNGVLLQVGFMRRFDTDFQAAAARIEAGEIGRPMVIRSLTHGPGLPPSWARDLKTSNGMLAEVNSHDFDSVRWLAHADPQTVYAEVSNFKGERHGVNTPNFYDTALVNIRFESSALASISGVCPCDYGYDARMEIVGEKGLIQIGAIQGQSVVLCTDREHGAVAPIYRSWPERFGSAYVRELKHFLMCIRTDTTPSVGGHDGRWAVAIVLAANQSFLQQRRVQMTELLEGAARAAEAKA